MPWCPICAEEYEQGIARCADCGASLVPQPPPPELPPDPTQPEEVVRNRDSRILDKAVQFLASQDIPSQVVPLSPESGLQDGFALVVDARFWDHAVAVILPFLNSPPDPDEPDPQKLLPESLNRPLTEIIDEGPGSLVDLAKAILVGDPPMVVKAEYALDQIGEPARRLLLQMLGDAIQADDSWRIRRICRPLARFRNPDTLRSVLALLDRNQNTIAVITALGYLEDLHAVPRLVQFLDDRDPSVRDEAAESLYNVTGETFDFEAEDDPESRAESVNRWIRWMDVHDLV